MQLATKCVVCRKRARATQTDRQRLFFLCLACFEEHEAGRNRHSRGTDPTPAEIRRECRKIQATWEPEEEEKRRRSAESYVAY